MTLQEFNELSADDQEAYLTAAGINDTNVIDLTAERDSLQEENNTLKGSITALTNELKQVKTTNYTLSRQIDAQDTVRDPEEIINEMFK